MIVKVFDHETDAEIHQYNPENNARVPFTNDRIWVPDNGDVPYIVRERHFDYSTDPTVLRLYCVEENRA